MKTNGQLVGGDLIQKFDLCMEQNESIQIDGHERLLRQAIYVSLSYKVYLC